ncbi:MAG TPA: hypothetical protein VGK00_16125 [Anaerolineales bacterium]|jgi:hypothetical protein
MEAGTIQKLISIFHSSFHELGVEVSLEQLEYLSVTIHRAMTVQARHFHTLEHVFNFVDPNHAIVSLAALYHDIVYHQVDMGFSPYIWEIISPYLRQEAEEFFVNDLVPQTDRLYYLTLEIFDLLPGQKLTSSAGLNEFLSALVMNKQLGGLLPHKCLALMTMCIEATVPFRAYSPDGKNHYEQMELRLPHIFKRYQLDITSAELVTAIATAVTFANKDIENFAESDPGRFLDNTWKLLPETNPDLRQPDVYSIGTYRLSLERMSAFFTKLDAGTVFSQYRDVPDNEEYARMVRLASKNIQVAILYLGIKTLGISIIEALAQATGGDAPLSLFMGDIPREGLAIKRLEYFLPEVENPGWVDHESILYHLFESGRASETSFDMKNSPLSLFIYKTVPPQQIPPYLERARSFQAGSLSPEDFLAAIDPQVLRPIARASSIMVFTRRQALLKFAGEN